MSFALVTDTHARDQGSCWPFGFAFATYLRDPLGRTPQATGQRPGLRPYSGRKSYSGQGRPFGPTFLPSYTRTRHLRPSSDCPPTVPF